VPTPSARWRSQQSHFPAPPRPSPLPLFILAPPAPSVPPPVQAAPSDDEGTVVEMPARLERRIVGYATREAPGTVIFDTPNAYRYYVPAAVRRSATA
jgi:lipoprotein-anchoring transpeptidase ErfK/SrfK